VAVRGAGLAPKILFCLLRLESAGDPMAKAMIDARTGLSVHEWQARLHELRQRR
jgi:hypothetical protein